MAARTHRALTFETYRLQGTPSSILVDRDGILRTQGLAEPLEGFGRADVFRLHAARFDASSSIS